MLLLLLLLLQERSCWHLPACGASCGPGRALQGHGCVPKTHIFSTYRHLSAGPALPNALRPRGARRGARARGYAPDTPLTREATPARGPRADQSLIGHRPPPGLRGGHSGLGRG
eukprot:scaffold260_cov328-Prasinococcus_capsulatus_cf.AAC.9